MRRLNLNANNKQDGIAMVEFAVVLPFLLLTMAIVGEMGFVMYQQNLLNKAVESGGLYVSVNSTTGAGFVDVSAQEIQNTRNMVVYGNTTGIGEPIIADLDPLEINVTCTYGTRNGYCIKNFNLTPITIQANYTYNPVLGEVFDNVTGFNFFPLPLSATTIVETI